jgi:hypothetical protein
MVNRNCLQGSSQAQENQVDRVNPHVVSPIQGICLLELLFYPTSGVKSTLIFITLQFWATHHAVHVSLAGPVSCGHLAGDPSIMNGIILFKTGPLLIFSPDKKAEEV